MPWILCTIMRVPLITGLPLQMAGLIAITVGIHNAGSRLWVNGAMGCWTFLGLVLTAAVGMGQHVQFGSLLNGFPVGRPAMDSRGNLVQLTQSLALGMCCGVGTGLVTLVERYERDGSSRLLADTGLGGTRDVPVFVALDARDRIYVGVQREAWRPYLLRIDGEARERMDVLEPGMRLLGTGFGPDGAPVVAGSADGAARAMAVDSMGVVFLGVGSSVVRVGGDSVDIGRAVTALAVGGDGAVYAAGADGAIVRVGGTVSMVLEGAVIDGLAVDERGRVVVHGPGLLARLDAGLLTVERRLAETGLVSTGLPLGYRGGVVFFVLGGSVAAVDLDRDEPAEVFRVVSGASYRGLTALTPGQLVTLFGRGLGREVFVDGVRAEVLYASPEQVNIVVPMGISTNSWMVMPGVFARNFRWAGTNVEVLAAAVEGEWVTVLVTGTGIGERFVVYLGERRVEEVSVVAGSGGGSEVRFRVPEGVRGTVRFWVVPEYAPGRLGVGGVLDVG